MLDKIWVNDVNSSPIYYDSYQGTIMPRPSVDKASFLHLSLPAEPQHPLASVQGPQGALGEVKRAEVDNTRTHTFALPESRFPASLCRR